MPMLNEGKKKENCCMQKKYVVHVELSSVGFVANEYI